MNFENAHDITATYNRYAQDSGNYHSVTYVTNHITDSFNTKHKNSHNGHGRGGCAVVGALLLAAVPVIIGIVFCNMLAGWLT